MFLPTNIWLLTFLINSTLIITSRKCLIIASSEEVLEAGKFIMSLKIIVSPPMFAFAVKKGSYLRHSVKKMIIGGWKTYYELENNCKSTNIFIWSKKRFLFETLITLLSYRNVKFGVVVYPESHGERLR